MILKTLGLGTGLFLLKPWKVSLLRAEEKPKKRPDRYFIFCYFNGGWDTLLCLDPRDPNSFKDEKKSETKIELAWDRIPSKFSDGQPVKKEIFQPKGSQIEFGPAARPFAEARHFEVSCVVRGISMDTVTHAVGRRYFLTGLMPAGLTPRGSSTSTAIVAQEGDLTPIPNLSARVESFNQGLPNFASALQVSSVYDLLSTLRKGPQAPRGELLNMIRAYREQKQDCDPFVLKDQELVALIRASQRKANVLIDSNLSAIFNFLDPKDSDMKAIRDRYKIKSLNSPEAQAAMAYQAVKYNVAQCVSIEMTNRLDTHGEEWANQQIEQLYVGFKALSQLITDLRKTEDPDNPNQTLLDRTTVIAFSEFGRQPLLNNRGGRDHWIASSALLIGAGVPHNKVIGATTEKGMGPVEIDPLTGKPVKGKGTTLTPTLVLASVLESAGLDTTHLRTNGLPCLMRK